MRGFRRDIADLPANLKGIKRNQKEQKALSAYSLL